MVEWVRNILLFTVFFSVVLYMMPNENYRKYIQTAIGFVMIIVIINPVVDVLGCAGKLSFSIRYEMANEDYIDMEDEYYKDVIGAVIENSISEEYKLDSKVSVSINSDNSISRIEVICENIDEENAEKLRNELSQKYSIKEDMVIIY